MKAYSQDMRERTLAALGRGERPADIARRYEVSWEWVYTVKRRWEREGERGGKRLGGYRRSRLAGLEGTVTGWLAAEPGLTLEQMRERLRVGHAIEIAVSSLWRRLQRWGLRLKKKPARQRAGAAGRGPSA